MGKKNIEDRIKIAKKRLNWIKIRLKYDEKILNINENLVQF